MDYFKVYNLLITSRLKLKEDRISALKKSKKLGKSEVYFEKHHILPKALGGNNDKSNIVYLTAREHFLAHLLLCEMYPSSKAMKFALWGMCNQKSKDIKRNYRISSRVYENARKAFAISNSIIHSGKKLSEQHVEIIRERWITNNPHRPGKLSHLYDKPRTTDTKSKISKTKLASPELNSSFKGNYVTPFGIFKSTSEIQRITNLGKHKIINFCKNNSITVNKRMIAQSKIFKEQDLGKSFKELGWDFQPLLQK